ncbi:hypothetical protein [Nocardiopsis trehalosi]|jgi:hypothetical protein|uniref:hypothetical protein n=1 Tax=Nocardiopsis trehalosi TaxID=109329 RepID=UPI0008320DBC|nr:hypothetical protein [Nocardiopsis trehalosi]
MADSGEAPFKVADRFRFTWNGVWLTVACLVFTGTGVALIVRGGAFDTGMGIIAVVVFGGGGLLAASRVLSRRPVLVLDSTGVCVVAPWPRSASDDVRLPWSDIALVRACTQVVRYRGGAAHLTYLVFVARDEESEPYRPPVPWHPQHAVRVHTTWDHGVEEIVAEARRHRPGLPFDDRRVPGGRRV